MWFNAYNFQTHKLIHRDPIKSNIIVQPIIDYELDVIVTAPNLLLGNITILQNIGTLSDPKYVKVDIIESPVFELDVVISSPNLLLGNIIILQNVGTPEKPEYIEMDVTLESP